MSEVKYFSEEGLANLRKELKELKTKGRADMAHQIREAREKGDLSENAEYDAAKEAQGHLEMRIAKLEDSIGNARILTSKDIDTSKVQILSKVKILNTGNKSEAIYQIVSETEADIKSGKISVDSPIGRGLLGKKVGEVAKIQAPAGELEFKVVSINI